MKRVRRCLIVVATVLLAIASTQITIAAPGRICSFAMPEDPTPLMRPRPLCSMKGSNPRAAVARLTALLASNGFTLEEASDVTGEIHARAKLTDGEERVVIWIERDLSQPLLSFTVYLQSGRYQRVLGEAELRRVTSSLTPRLKQLKSNLVRTLGAS